MQGCEEWGREGGGDGGRSGWERKREEGVRGWRKRDGRREDERRERDDGGG